MTLRSSDLQSDSDLDSIRNSCDVLFAVWTCAIAYFDLYINIIPLNDQANIYFVSVACVFLSQFMFVWTDNCSIFLNPISDF